MSKKNKNRVSTVESDVARQNGIQPPPPNNAHVISPEQAIAIPITNLDESRPNHQPNGKEPENNEAVLAKPAPKRALHQADTEESHNNPAADKIDSVNGHAASNVKHSVSDAKNSDAKNPASDAKNNVNAVATPELKTIKLHPSQITHKQIFSALHSLPPLPTADASAFIEIEPETEEIEALNGLFGRLPSYYSQTDYDLVLKAYVVASYAHRLQRRQSGEAYVLHPIEVTWILADLRMDADTLAAGLLHDVAEDTQFDIAYIENHFGAAVSNMVDGVTKLKRINQLSNVRQGIADQKAESLRKMFLAMVEDVRVVLIKLADRLHNMRTLG
ncbi:MAG: bifunctional (p)ppGpp synthetase/guanosine-3',5'-bis(diphosphate) 3'-pyrophosphohydrolase, partial [Caldilineaceae bacterium]|nr:bifunctional (p)ppGpp synthetase/guanosine-3',5'-bis(diphosphate) 3'-pyrophosphohydrolase [Caldilineaceae bacterium]